MEISLRRYKCHYLCRKHDRIKYQHINRRSHPFRHNKTISSFYLTTDIFNISIFPIRRHENNQENNIKQRKHPGGQMCHKNLQDLKIIRIHALAAFINTKLKRCCIITFLISLR